ncbi:MAG: DUF4159 domain-containing protein [Phycisphaerales bacterium]|nr:DUF4159 domain-containing protein [Phycisphaerales bacterium]
MIVGALWAAAVCPPVAVAAPNLVANGDLERPPQRAEARLSPTESEVIFEIPGEAGFGRVIARGQDMGAALKRDMRVGYARTSAPGLLIDAKEVEAKNPYDISIWFDLRGQIRPNRRYAYSVFCLPTEQNSGIPDLDMVAPAIWADGNLIGSTAHLSWPTQKRVTYDDLTLSGVVKTPDFKHQTGGQWFVLKLPRSFKGQLFVKRVSLRELDDALLSGAEKAMPTPTRYVPVDDILEEEIANAIRLSTQAIKATQSPDGYWQAGGVDDSVQLTASFLEVLARQGADLTEKPMRKAMEWLAEQEPTTTAAVAQRLSFLARYGRAEHRQTIAKDVMRLSRAQFDDGGWNESSADDVQKDRKLHSANLPTMSACLALYEAHYAGVKADTRLWRKAAGYWRDAQARDGGFRAMLDNYGGLGEATTTANTAMGLGGLLVTLDMAFADGSPRCTQYLSNTAQREGMQRGLDWMDEYYDEYYKKLPTLDAQPDPFFNAGAMLELMKQSGVRRFRDKDVYRTEAENILRFFDTNSGLFAGSLAYTATGLYVLGEGGAPIVVNRLILGGSPDFRLSRDAAHMVRYLIEQRREPLNWAETDLATKVDEWLKVPILYIDAAGEQEVSDAQWQRIRDYCFGGGVVVCNIAEDYAAGRAQFEAGLQKVFPEYTLKEMPSGDPFWGEDEAKMPAIPGIQTIGNGLKHMVFVLPQDWSCRLNTYQLKDHPETFKFFDHLLTYTRDGEKPRSDFERTTWEQPAVPTMTVGVARMEVGGYTPAYPDLLKTLDRSMRAEYRLEVDDVPADDTAKPAALLWVSCAGPKPMSDAQRQQIKRRLADGSFIFAEVLSGNPNWAESFRSDLLRLDDTLRIRKLPANHPLVTGRLYETFGYDLRETNVRRALRKEYTKLPRLDAYVIEKNGEEVGMLSVHDVGSGLGYVLYPGCRGVMPHESRQVAVNVVLYAMQRQLKVD